MNQMNTSFKNLQDNENNGEENNNNSSIWTVTNSPTEDGITEQEFYDEKNVINELNHDTKNYLENAPKRLRERCDS